MWSGTLTTTEARYTEGILQALSRVAWAAPLLAKVNAEGGLTAGAMPVLFEARVAYEIHRASRQAEYEFATGVGTSTVDFRVLGSPEWLIETVSVRESDAVKRATIQVDKHEWQRELSTDAADRAQSEEAEMITAQQKIAEKVYSRGLPTKFPVPNGSAYHVILTDMRGYLGAGGDRADYRHIVYGADGVRREPMLIRWWTGPDGKRAPIKGLLEPGNPLKGAAYIRERIHFLGFVEEDQFRVGAIRQQAYHLANDHFFKTDEEVARVIDSYPLRGRRKT